MTSPQWLIPILVAAATSTATAPATNTPPAKLEFPLAGFRINNYAAASNGVSVLNMALPVPDTRAWFSVSVYCSDKIDSNPFVQKHFQGRSGETLLSERVLSPTESQIEYTAQGDKPGDKGHVYVRKIVAHGKAYEISGSLPDTDWPTAGTKLKMYVDSFEPSPDPAPGKVAFPRQGFRIMVLDGVIPANAQGMLLAFSPGGPVVDIKPYAKTLKDYQAERKPPWMLDSKHKFKILAESMPAENALLTEYGEDFSTDKAHPQFSPTCYEKVVLAHGQLYRAWGSFTNQADWKSFPQIKACVESLEAIPTPAPVGAPTPAK